MRETYELPVAKKAIWKWLLCNVSFFALMVYAVTSGNQYASNALKFLLWLNLLVSLGLGGMAGLGHYEELKKFTHRPCSRKINGLYEILFCGVMTTFGWWGYAAISFITFVLQEMAFQDIARLHAEVKKIKKEEECPMETRAMAAYVPEEDFNRIVSDLFGIESFGDMDELKDELADSAVGKDDSCQVMMKKGVVIIVKNSIFVCLKKKEDGQFGIAITNNNFKVDLEETDFYKETVSKLITELEAFGFHSVARRR